MTARGLESMAHLSSTEEGWHRTAEKAKQIASDWERIREIVEAGGVDDYIESDDFAEFMSRSEEQMRAALIYSRECLDRLGVRPRGGPAEPSRCKSEQASSSSPAQRPSRTNGGRNSPTRSPHVETLTGRETIGKRSSSRTIYGSCATSISAESSRVRAICRAARAVTTRAMTLPS